MSQKNYWKGIEELENTPDYQKSLENEFNEELPLNLSGKLLESTTPRRDFLKFLGFSTAAATIAASCEMPVRKAIPYAIKPDADVITPSIPNYYASSFIDNGDYCAVLVKTRDGRPIMIEGNKQSSVTKGGVSARVVAATLGMYDNARLRQPRVSNKEVDTFEEVDGAIAKELASAKGTIYLVTGSVNSPSTNAVIAQFLGKYPNAKHLVFDPVSYSALIQANEISYGKKAIPTYEFEKAQTIFSLGADFLGSWLAPIEFNDGYTKNRKVTAKKPVMSKHYQVEGILSTTGANADERATCKPSEYGKVAAALYAAITTGAKPNLSTPALSKLVANAAVDLKKGNGLVVAGVNDVNIQIIVNAINSAIGANGTTINWAIPVNYKQGIDSEMVAFVNELNSGSVGAVLIHGVNPAYEYYDSAKFVDGLKKVPTTISFSDHLDETAELCKYIVPDNHWLESWGDVEPRSGYYSFIQPTIAPLFKTRQYQDSLLKWANISDTYHDLLFTYWISKLGSEENFEKALQDGVVEPAEVPSAGATFSGNVTEAIAKASSTKAGEYEVVVYSSVALGHGGAWSNNPWLQEMPDPITRGTWDNYVVMSPKTAKEKFHAELTGINQVDPNKRLVEVTVNGKKVKLPIVVTPGVNNNVIGIALGYGRSKNVGKAAADLGQNAYPLLSYNGSNFIYDNAGTVTETNDFYPVAITQTHNSAEHRPILHEYTLEEFKKDPYELFNERRKEVGEFTVIPWEEKEGEEKEVKGDFDAKKFDDDFVEHGSSYPVQEHQGIKWGMSIDLNSCTGCGACVIACQAENNVSVVGKERVLKVQEMSWLKIDRYFSGDPNDPDSIQTVFQPMLCQHCDNAPCENVCPVNATNHSSEGLNQMAYNRCIGTKYCANNCPFKVRRFNWYDWNGADSFKDNLYEDGRRDDVNSDLERMVLNPDVTVRSRGVMEKCTFCVQRLQEGKLVALKEGVPLKDHHVTTACQTACAGNCISFGNVNDPESAVYKERYVDNKERLFYMLENLHVLPNVSYLSKIRNSDVVASASDENDKIYVEHL